MDKISAFTSAGTLTGVELVPIVQSGVTVKTTTQDIANLLLSSKIRIKKLTSQFDVASSTTVANIPDLDVTVEAGKSYKFTAILYCSSAAGAGAKVTIDGTSTVSNIIYEVLGYGGGTVTAEGRATSLGTVLQAASYHQYPYIIIEGSATVTGNGTLVPKFSQYSSNVTPSSVLVGSTFTITEI